MQHTHKQQHSSTVEVKVFQRPDTLTMFPLAHWLPGDTDTVALLAAAAPSLWIRAACGLGRLNSSSYYSLVGADRMDVRPPHSGKLRSLMVLGGEISNCDWFLYGFLPCVPPPWLEASKLANSRYN